VEQGLGAAHCYTMSHVGKYALTIVAGGLALGAVLGSAADPEMKQPAPQWWQQTGRPNAADYSTDDAWPATAPAYPGMADSYRPDLDYGTVVTSYWEPPADWRWYAEDDAEAVSTPPPAAAAGPVDDPAPQAAGDAAAEVAAAALGARAGSVPADAATPGEPRLTDDGLY